MLKYLGGGHIHGVPARDLTDAEERVHAKTIKEQEALTGTKLYETVKAKANKPEPEDVPAEEDAK